MVVLFCFTIFFFFFFFQAEDGIRDPLVTGVQTCDLPISHIPGIEIAGKTGTAQLVANSRADRGQDNAWFAAFAPANDPQYVVVVMIERGGKGGEVAAPIARAIYDAIFFEKVASAGLSG